MCCRAAVEVRKLAINLAVPSIQPNVSPLTDSPWHDGGSRKCGPYHHHHHKPSSVQRIALQNGAEVNENTFSDPEGELR